MSMVLRWTQDDLDRAISLWREGVSASQIGRELGRSRNSVLGKLMRGGHLKDGECRPLGNAARAVFKAVREKRTRVDMAEALGLDPLGDEALASPGLCKFLASSWDRCCGRPIEIDGSPYCDAHRAVAYRVAVKRAAA